MKCSTQDTYGEEQTRGKVRPGGILLQLNTWVAEGSNVLRHVSTSTPSVRLPQQQQTTRTGWDAWHRAHDLADPVRSTSRLHLHQRMQLFQLHGRPSIQRRWGKQWRRFVQLGGVCY